MLVKLTCRGRDYPAAVARARRALAEFRIRGVSTNIPFLQAVLDDPDFVAGRREPPRSSTNGPSCSRPAVSADRGTKLLTWLADVTVNEPNGEPKVHRTRRDKLPAARSDRQARRVPPAAPGARARKDSPRPCARRTPSPSPTPRSATRTSRCSPPGCAPATSWRPAARVAGSRRSCSRSRPGAGRPTTSRCASSREDPWERLAALREALPNLCLQMLLRGRNTVGYTPYPDEVTDGVRRGGRRDGHRHLPHLRRPQRRRADAPGHRGRAARPVPPSPRSPSATPRDLLDPDERRSTPSTTTCELAPNDRRRRGAHPRDQGHGRTAAPAAAAAPRDGAARAVRPAGPPAHPRHRRRPAGHPPRGRGRRRRRRGRAPRPPLAGHHQPALGLRPRRRAGPHRRATPGSTSRTSCDLEPYWEAVRRVYAPFESGLPGPTGRVYQPRDPGRPAVQPAPAGDRAGPGRAFRGDRGHVHRGGPDPRPPREGDAVVQGGGRPRPAPGGPQRRSRPTSTRTRRSTTSRTP